MKKPDFRKLFAEYAQEISDPENKKVDRNIVIVPCQNDDHYPLQKYEEELIALEKQRGVDMKYIHPKVCLVCTHTHTHTHYCGGVYTLFLSHADLTPEVI